ncbi:MAG: hypothetical protein LR015_10590 [Verrucomicrobia bacterium]|nr:hypothetical protein [Verrucomicrobiota bacterium]
MTGGTTGGAPAPPARGRGGGFGALGLTPTFGGVTTPGPERGITGGGDEMVGCEGGKTGGRCGTETGGTAGGGVTCGACPAETGLTGTGGAITGGLGGKTGGAFTFAAGAGGTCTVLASSASFGLEATGAVGDAVVVGITGRGG